jgi:hypothetical protein
MIRLIVFSTIIIFAISVSAQQKPGTKVPENVVKSFQSDHPKAQDITWDKEGVNYEANYKENNNSFSVVIDKEGQILETESEISISDLPPGTVKYINDNYKDYSLSGAAKIVDNKGNVKYEAEIKNGETSRDVMFGKDGKPFKSKKENENNEEED